MKKYLTPEINCKTIVSEDIILLSQEVDMNTGVLFSEESEAAEIALFEKRNSAN